jgi:hypothetical protein
LLSAFKGQAYQDLPPPAWVLDGGKGIELERIRCESRVFRHPDFGKNFSESDIGARF